MGGLRAFLSLLPTKYRQVGCFYILQIISSLKSEENQFSTINVYVEALVFTLLDKNCVDHILKLLSVDNLSVFVGLQLGSFLIRCVQMIDQLEIASTRLGQMK